MKNACRHCGQYHDLACLSPAPAPLKERLTALAEACDEGARGFRSSSCAAQAEQQETWAATIREAVSALSPQPPEDHGYRIQCPFCRRWTNHLNENQCGWCSATLIQGSPQPPSEARK